MTAPLFDALRSLSRSGTHRFHLPGHKGKGGFPDVFELDFTEIPATGNLYGENGIIQLAERECARYYGARRCFYLTCGATQGVKAALAAYCGEGARVVLDRNCHQSAMDACAALDLHPEFIYPDITEIGITGNIPPEHLALALKRSSARAAMVTSPTYYGHNLNIRALSDAAHSANASLLVDSAHGSHLRACGVADPLAQGADAVVFSAHKTLSALGQGALLLVQNADEDFCARVRAFTAFFGTTSPSYPIMASLDLARFELEANPESYRVCSALCLQTAKAIDESTPFTVLSPAPGSDPCRLTVCTATGGISGYCASQMLRERKIEPEMADENSIVLIFTANDSESDARALCDALIEIGANASPSPLPPPLPLPKPIRKISPRSALFAPSQRVALSQSTGKIAAQNLSPYPPGVPVITIGEQIDDFAVEYLLRKGYNEHSDILVVAESTG